MSGPMAAGYGIETAVLISARSIMTGVAEIADGLSAADAEAAERQRQRRTERQQRRATAAGQAQQARQAAEQANLARLTALLAEGSAAALADAPAVDAARLQSIAAQAQPLGEQLATFVQEQQLQEAAAVVLEQSLQDLGYAVEEIDETLFVEGGVAHFQRADWGDYFIRLRIDPKRNAMNFNVVRAGTRGEDRQREDMLAEERWCSEFPKLFGTLKARGIPITVTRLLQAGEVPVQVVDAASLPARTTEERRHEPLKTRSRS